MARRKSRKWWKNIFGTRFDIWDLILISIIIGYPAYIITSQNLNLAQFFQMMLAEVGQYIWSAILIALIVKLIVNRAKK